MYMCVVVFTIVSMFAVVQSWWPLFEIMSMNEEFILIQIVSSQNKFNSGTGEFELPEQKNKTLFKTWSAFPLVSINLYSKISRLCLKDERKSTIQPNLHERSSSSIQSCRTQPQWKQTTVSKLVIDWLFKNEKQI